MTDPCSTPSHSSDTQSVSSECAPSPLANGPIAHASHIASLNRLCTIDRDRCASTCALAASVSAAPRAGSVPRRPNGAATHPPPVIATTTALPAASTYRSVPTPHAGRADERVKGGTGGDE